MKVIHTDNAPKALGPYSQAIAAPPFLFISGQGGIDPKSGKLADGLEAQAELLMKNIKEILASAGSSYDKVVKVTCFLTEMTDFAAFNAIYEKYFVSKPARSCIAAKQLPLGMLCEIEVIALID